MTDVHKYLQGDLSAREMHALEKAALDDPFLADALEGLATPPALEQDLTELRTRLDERVAEKKSRLVFLPRIRVAAAVILLAGLGVTAIITTSKHKAETAKTAPLPSPAADVASGLTAKPAAPAAAEPAATQTQPTPDREVAASSNVARSATHTRRQAPLAESRTSEAEIQDIADSLEVSETLAANAARNQASIPTFSIKKDTVNYNADLRANSKPLPTQPLLFAGQVRDINNRPLAGVSLVLEGKSNRTVTDQEGYFKLYVPPRDTVRKLTVDFVGYDETSVALNNDNRFGNVITLRERQSSLQEVVVTGLGTKRKETMAAPPSDDAERLDSLWTRAAPTIGRVAYLDYLAAGKKGLGADSTTHGTVSISFDIDQKGQPSDFKIEQSLSPVQDAGVIRLISEGSAWQLLHGKKARLLVSVSFP
jgi:cytoskeletal protein RodZ